MAAVFLNSLSLTATDLCALQFPAEEIRQKINNDGKINGVSASFISKQLRIVKAPK